MSLGQFIKDLRRERGFTQRELADLLGVRQPTLSRWESDQAMPDFQLVEQISNICNVHKDAILRFYTSLRFTGQTDIGATGLSEDPRELIIGGAERTTAQRLKEARFTAGYATAKIAAEANGWSYATYLSHESGRRRLRLRAATVYAAAFKCPVERLFVDEPAKIATHRDGSVRHDGIEKHDVDLRLEALWSNMDMDVKHKLLDIAHILVLGAAPAKE